MSTIRFAIRSLWKRRAVSSVVVLTAGLAISVNGALFAVLNGLLFRPLPYPDAPRIAHLNAPRARFLSPPDLGARVMETAATTALLRNRCVVKSESPFQTGSPAQAVAPGRDPPLDDDEDVAAFDSLAISTHS